VKIFLDRRNRPKRDNWIREGICRGRTISANRGTDRECLLNLWSLTTDFEGCLKLEENGLLHENFFGFVAKPFDLAFKKVYLLGDFGVSHREQFFDDVIDVYLYLALHLYIIQIARLFWGNSDNILVIHAYKNFVFTAKIIRDFSKWHY